MTIKPKTTKKSATAPMQVSPAGAYGNIKDAERAALGKAQAKYLAKVTAPLKAPVNPPMSGPTPSGATSRDGINQATSGRKSGKPTKPTRRGTPDSRWTR